jgi:hypothetical protein
MIERAKRLHVVVAAGLSIVAAVSPVVRMTRAAETPPAAAPAAKREACEDCHRRLSPALVMEWEGSRHGQAGVGCEACHEADKTDVDAWQHEGTWVSSLVTPKDCARCHEQEYTEFSHSHHARAGEILASLDNVLAEKVAGMPGNVADAVNGCWQCHGSIVKFKRDANGAVARAESGRPIIDPTTWPNSGVGRLNPDGSKGSCHACHARHAFQAKLSRSPENCGKCHMGPDHPQIEIYDESKHGIAFYANRDRMALDKDSWILGKDYSAAPTCATCHIGGYMTPQGVAAGNSHDVGERISWTLRPVVSTKLNLVVYEDGHKEDFPDTKPLPKVGDTVETSDKVVKDEKLETVMRSRKVAKVLTWQDRRKQMKGVCLNCHNDTYVDNFYEQFDSLVVLYNEKFAKPAQALMNDLQADGAINPKAPFEHDVQWIFYELWHHEGRRARHGASMMGPDYTHWHGMYEVGKHFYAEFLPAVVETAGKKSPELRKKYEAKVQELLAKGEHVWLKGMTPAEAEALRKEYQQRYNQ